MTSPGYTPFSCWRGSTPVLFDRFLISLITAPSQSLRKIHNQQASVYCRNTHPHASPPRIKLQWLSRAVIYTQVQSTVRAVNPTFSKRKMLRRASNVFRPPLRPRPVRSALSPGGNKGLSAVTPGLLAGGNVN